MFNHGRLKSQIAREETKANKPRTFTRYEVRVGRKKVHGGITERPLDQRAAEHKRKYPGVKVTKVGPKVTEKSARQWEKDKGYS